MTIYDIAKLAGVSASTVSRVINNKPGIGLKTRLRVEALLKEYAYTPNQVARGLVNKSSKVIGVITSDITSPHHSLAAHFINNQLNKNGYCSIIINTNVDITSMQNSIKSMLIRQVEGIILLGSVFQNNIVESALKKELSKIPVIIVNGEYNLPNTYSILSDEKQGVIDCVKLLADKSRKNIAFVINEYTPSNKKKLAGYIDGLKLYLPNKAPIIAECTNTIASSYNATLKLIKTHPNIDGIIYVIDFLAAASMRAFIDLNISIPKKVSIIGIDNSTFTDVTYPRITSLDNKILTLSKEAVTTLINVLTHKPVIKKQILSTELIIKEST